ncbi:uncharacterized protein [Manis javanica]|uniref:uncharacterized protein isoform X2 n=1 Tax=Manis javanica TaxID=9974 RepID=UPI00187AC0EF|nr:uncharacterized protein LOC118971428 isoform X2 [Manis javanica]
MTAKLETWLKYCWLRLQIILRSDRDTLRNWPLDKYVDDILVATEDQERCLQGTKDLLSTLGALGYRAQICKTETPTSLNPATLLPDLDWEAPLHDCGEILAHVHGVRTDLRDQPLAEADATWYTDGSSFMQDRVRYAGSAVTTETETVWAEPLAPGTSAQLAELIALTRALTMAKGKCLNVYMDSRYAFATAHIHGAIYRESGLLTAEGKTIKNKEEILGLLWALWLPKALAIIHFPGHQKSDTLIAKGNRLADQCARQAALSVDHALVTTLPDPGAPNLPDTPSYTDKNTKWIKQLPMTNYLNGWWRAANCIILPEELGQYVLTKLHWATHMGMRKMEDLGRHAHITIRDSIKNWTNRSKLQGLPTDKCDCPRAQPWYQTLRKQTRRLLGSRFYGSKVWKIWVQVFASVCRHFFRLNRGISHQT